MLLPICGFARDKSCDSTARALRGVVLLALRLRRGYLMTSYPVVPNAQHYIHILTLIPKTSATIEHNHQRPAIINMCPSSH